MYLNRPVRIMQGSIRSIQETIQYKKSRKKVVQKPLILMRHFPQNNIIIILRIISQENPDWMKKTHAKPQKLMQT